ncbi:hypothetical protein Tco_0657877 [Tanacetum coccineum]
MTRLELFRLKSIWGIPSIMLVAWPGDSSAKRALWSRISDFMHHHTGRHILFGDLNEVREESERYGSIFSAGEAQVFNSFINDKGTCKKEVAKLLNSLDMRIDAGQASDGDREERINLLNEYDEIEKREALDLCQKSRIKWDVKGDENSKKIHRIIKHKRRTQTVQGLMIDDI